MQKYHRAARAFKALLSHHIKYYMLSLEQVAENLLELTLPVKMAMSLSAVRYLERRVRFNARRYATPGTSCTAIGTPNLDNDVVNRSLAYSLTFSADRGRFRI